MIVVVDDTADAADILVKLLKRTGLDATAVYCGDELFAHLESIATLPSLVILDLHMPRIDGMDCLRTLRADPRWRTVPVVMYTADFNPDRMREAAQLGVHDYVVKGTIRWTEFAEILNRYVRPTPPA